MIKEIYYFKRKLNLNRINHIIIIIRTFTLFYNSKKKSVGSSSCIAKMRVKRRVGKRLVN